MIEWGPILLTFKLAAITTVLLFLVSVPLASWLTLTKSGLKPVIETMVSMPLVLPPTVLGFYLLLAFSPTSVIGRFLNETFGLRLAFSFEGLIVASLVYSLPFMVHPLQSGLRNLPSSLAEASFVLGRSRRATLLRVLLPNIKPSILTGIVLSFAHTVGEFGVVLMIGGSIPDKTKVASIAIYEEVESMHYANAHVYSIILIVVTFTILLAVHIVNAGYFKSFWK